METLQVKGMLCGRCISAVESVLSTMGINAESVSLGQIHFKELPEKNIERLQESLHSIGLSVADSGKHLLLSKLRKTIEDFYSAENDFLDGYSWQTYLSTRLNLPFAELSRIFMEKEGISLEQYCISVRIRRAKILLDKKKLSILEIAEKLGYSSVAHLSTQFKSKTGFSPAAYRMRNSN